MLPTVTGNLKTSPEPFLQQILRILFSQSVVLLKTEHGKKFQKTY